MANELVSMAQQFTGLPIDHLIGGPLKAAAQANSAMALTQTRFMLDTCFIQKKSGGLLNYEPIMINLVLTRSAIAPPKKEGGTPGVKEFSTTIKLPLLTIIPLNSLGVDNVDVSFEMEVKSSCSEDTEKKSETSVAANAELAMTFGWGPVKGSFKASVSYDHKDSSTHSTHYEKSNSAKYTINVHAGQLPLPKGVNTIIEAYSRAIEPVELKSGGASGS